MRNTTHHRKPAGTVTRKSSDSLYLPDTIWRRNKRVYCWSFILHFLWKSISCKRRKCFFFGNYVLRRAVAERNQQKKKEKKLLTRHSKKALAKDVVDFLFLKRQQLSSFLDFQSGEFDGRQQDAFLRQTEEDAHSAMRAQIIFQHLRVHL